MPLPSPVCLFVVFLMMFLLINPRTYTQQTHPHRSTRGGGGLMEPSPLGFWYVALYVLFRNGFAFSEKPLIFSTRGGIFYGWWWCWRSVTSPNTWSPCWILSSITSQVKKVRINNFLRLTCKITH